MIKFLDWDTDFFGVKCGKAVFDRALTDGEWSVFMSEQKDYGFVSIVNTSSNVDNAVKITGDTAAFLADTNVQLSKPVKDTAAPDGIAVKEALPYNEAFTRLADFEHSKFFHDRRLRERGGEKVYEQWIINSFDKKGKFFAYAGELGYCIFSFKNEDTCVIELIRVSNESRGKGIGTKLLDAVEHCARSKNCTTIVVGTQATNIGALNFYISYGFRILRTDSTYHLWNL